MVLSTANVGQVGGLLVWGTIFFSSVSMAIVVWYLLVRPPLDRATRIGLLFGIFVFPILAAMSGNIAGFEATKTRAFCGGCHVMEPYTEDASDPRSLTLASQHARNRSFGGKNCYSCHANYGMFGAVTTKMDGLIHAWVYYTELHKVPAKEAFGRIKLYRPYKNDNCMQCHSTSIPGFVEQEDHRGAIEDIRSGEISCMGEGCHGPAHPFSKVDSGGPR